MGRYGLKGLLPLLGVLGCARAGLDPALDAPGLRSYETGVRPRAVAVADLDGDGRLDVVVANAGDDTLTLLLGAPDGRPLRPQAPLPAGSEPGPALARARRRR